LGPTGFVRSNCICLAAVDGSHIRVVIPQRRHGVNSYFDPAWSALGQLAYTHGHYPQEGLGDEEVLVRATGTRALVVSGGVTGFDGMPNWAPDGRRVVLIGKNYGVGGSLYAGVANTGRTEPVLKDASLDDVDADPVWSPDGKKIAFARALGELTSFRLFVVNADGTGLRQLSHTPAHNPSWSPDGRRIVFDDGRRLRLINADGTSLRRLLAQDASGTDPAWSPDGRLIAYVRADSIWLTDPAGRYNRLLIKNADQPAWKP
jgi:TolB protein